MLYDNSIKDSVLDTLNNRVSSIADCIVSLFDNGYNPNKNKYVILTWSSILIDAYDNIDLFTEAKLIAYERCAAIKASSTIGR